MNTIGQVILIVVLSVVFGGIFSQVEVQVVADTREALGYIFAAILVTGGMIAYGLTEIVIKLWDIENLIWRQGGGHKEDYG